jgi:FixJ family two-component response regulator
LVVTDQAMPEITGTDLTQKFKEINPNVPVVIYTGHSETINLTNYSEYGASLLLMKPMSVLEMAPLLKPLIK